MKFSKYISKYIKTLRIQEAKSVDLKKFHTSIEPLYDSDEYYQKHLAKFQDELKSFQEKLYASSEYAVLIVFQGMDTAGKDGAISHVMSGVNPQGCRSYSFKTPSEDELKHDFLWRTHLKMPARGDIGIFNRSYYEEVLVPRVHSDILAHERLPKSTLREKHFWRMRLEDIRNHESYLDRQGIKVVKFFLHLSKEEQCKRLMDRVQEPKKNWKISSGDFHERKFWNEYQKAYESCFEGTSTKECPWFVIPADDKKNARILISRILLRELSDIPVGYPKLTSEQRKLLKSVKKSLSGAK